MVSLAEEFSLYPRQRAHDYLKRLSCPDNSLEYAAFTEIIPDTGGLFAPSLSGTPAIVVPVQTPEIIDLIAWIPAEPDKWYMRTGQGRILGLYDLQHAIVYRQPIKAHENPLKWLLSGCVGCCPLTVKSYTEFMGVTEIDTNEDLFHKIMCTLYASYPFPRKVCA
jgi:hypothetical protein